jgi:hypothetical protein
VISAARLRELYEYDPASGQFRRRVSSGGEWAGTVAGGVQSNGYRHIKIDGRQYKAHRLAFLYMGVPLAGEVDHVNGRRDDNRWSNLRDVPRAENVKNKRAYRNGSSPVPGVAWDKRHMKWGVKCQAGGVVHWLGRFVCLGEAVRARVQAGREYGFHPNHGRAG